MKIDRHNYEEHFILYMDNELSSEQRREVESFVQKNPDLKEELELLQQFKMAPDESVIFERKEELMSASITGTTPVTEIGLSNYEEWLVLYMDNELSLSQRKTAEHFIATESLVKNEWNLLQRTRLQPEEIIFADKSSLYRTEEKVRSIPVRWLRLRQAFGDRRWRIAAAILLFLAAGSVAIIVFNDRKSSPGKDREIVKQPVPAEQKVITDEQVVSPKETNTPKNETIALDNKQKNINPLRENIEPVVVKEKKDKVKTDLVNVPVQVKKEEPVIVDNNNKPSNNLPLPENDTRPINKIQSADVADNNNKKEFLSPNNALTKTDVTPTSSQPLNIVHAKAIEEDPSPSDGKKGKLRGILRKVTRTFEKRTNIDATDGEDRLLVAGLAIKLK